jgi:hypothetical protein
MATFSKSSGKKNGNRRKYMLNKLKNILFMKKITILIFLYTSLFLSAGISTETEYHGPTEQLIKRESWERIESKLKKMKIPLDLIPYFDSIASLETWGHIGYHGANQNYRIYQDIIKLTIEELLEIPVRDDFQFLRVPGDEDLNLETTDQFFNYWGKKIDNKHEIRAKQLLALNFAIYSNFDEEGSCSISLFVKDYSKTNLNYQLKLIPFYNEMGIPYKALNDLFSIATNWLDEDVGILLQISETSHQFDCKNEAYNFIDMICYPSKKGGVLHGKKPISSHYERILSDSYINSDIDIAPQLRLLISNQYTLNPTSDIIIRRWDLYDTELIVGYEQEMREYIRSMKYDADKVQLYREKLLDAWGQQ